MKKRTRLRMNKRKVGEERDKKTRETERERQRSIREQNTKSESGYKERKKN